ncbi:aldo/keto reductase [Salarchaeum sp. JOR-1]|uniref:aldo/keto reductase n=1 Tax=Salarchaeum sp. JOR-1 TaxID=2599399 RepID=UPI001198C3B4|nr:aldo/keto reductase [Salarchaeum sp. JOR-1]QDX40202.1 aldo/keto reductase [Salarchaeum sp. JOR-1]
MSEFDSFGLGTYQLTGSQCADSVATALDAGYRHVDTAQGYGNEGLVRRGIERSDVDASDVFVATKLSTDNLGYEDAVDSAHESAARLGVDSIDLLYVHWPLDTYSKEETIDALNDLHAEGVVDRVGLSNFRVDQLDAARDRLDPDPFAHQIECHPLLQQEALRAYAREHDHWVVAYCPIARNKVADVNVIQDIADAHDATPAQVSLAWLNGLENVAAVPKATSLDHITENFASRDITLTDREMNRIADIDDEHRIVDFDGAPWNEN